MPKIPLYPNFFFNQIFPKPVFSIESKFPLQLNAAHTQIILQVNSSYARISPITKFPSCSAFFTTEYFPYSFSYTRITLCPNFP